MSFLKKDYILIAAGIVLVLIAGLLIGVSARALFSRVTASTPAPATAAPTVAAAAVTQAAGATPTVAPPATQELPDPTATPEPTSTPLIEVTPEPAPDFFAGPILYGHSYDGRPLEAYRLGNGPSVRAIIGGIHGGYEWNTVELVSDTLAYLQDQRDAIPANVTLYLIPDANPDGYAAGTDPVVARMNGNGVDLNRNWDYQWQPEATHGTRPVSAGAYAFSEPETASLRDFIVDRRIELAIFYHSALGVVFSGADRDKCATFELAEMLSEVTGYRHQTEGIPGQITTGDSIDWLSTQGIAAVEVELTTHDRITRSEWQRNLDGILAFLKWTIPRPGGPSSSEAPGPGAAETFIYVVQDGDTLGHIAERCGVDQATIISLNDIDDPDMIQPGQELKLPVRCP